jgi:four helix bundle protein
MNSQELKNRTKKFSIEIIKLVEDLPNTPSGRAVASQLVRSGTSVGANYRAVCRSRSNKEFISKLNIVVEESDECEFWLEIIDELKWLNVEELLKEASELTAIFVSSLKTIIRNNSKK